MNRILTALAVVLTLGLATLDADAARRLGGGGNVGKQKATPTQKEATPAQSASPAPNQATAPAAAPAGAGAAAAAAPKPSFMSKWGGLLAGLGIGALLASMFGAQMGPIIGMLLMGLLLAAVVFLVIRFISNRNAATAAPAMGSAGPSIGSTAAQPAPTSEGGRPAFAGIGSNLRKEPTMNFDGANAAGAGATAAAAAAPVAAVAKPTLPADIDPQAFLRVAKSTFIRLQAANDAKDLSDIRDFTTPEVFAEISMQVGERKDEQKTEVVSVEAVLLDFAQEDGLDIASVRFYGLIREEVGKNPEPFDEIWHVRRKAGAKKDPWLIAGIQQYA